MSNPCLWVFGYGSLLWRPNFHFTERRLACLYGYRRRFWQGSIDHRGIPASPGRVVTLLPGLSTDLCWGIAYRLTEKEAPQILATLDYRERGGYVQRFETLTDATGEHFSALIYMATAQNPYYLGPASLEYMARQIASAVGPSGTNIDYLFNLAQALCEWGVEDEHVMDLERRVIALFPPED